MQHFDLNELEKDNIFIDNEYKCFLFLFNSDNLNEYFIDSTSGGTYLTNTGKNINAMLDGNFDISIINDLIKENENYQVDLFIVFKNDEFLKFFSITHYFRNEFINTIYEEEIDEKIESFCDKFKFNLKNNVKSRQDLMKISKGVFFKKGFDYGDVKNNIQIFFDITNIFNLPDMFNTKNSYVYHANLNQFVKGPQYLFVGLLEHSLCPLALEINEENDIIINLINDKTMSCSKFKEKYCMDLSIEDAMLLLNKSNIVKN